MQLKTGRFGPYFACTSCDNTRKVLKNGQPAPPRVDPIKMEHLRSTKHDDFLCCVMVQQVCLAASKFPKIRETRARKLLNCVLLLINLIQSINICFKLLMLILKVIRRCEI
jgi:DNA topoisomerase-1